MKIIWVAVVILLLGLTVWKVLPLVLKNNGDEVCIQVITPARNPETGEVKEFPTPCDVPKGWEITQSH
ncbi:MAG: hypothetical protein A3J47_02240 [Candidatus Yanofskybacteria bacterium RIFCSPHIGHO2_02_FULL_43_22]|uniref:Uncharacterized protein n=1 Tax=Candidatus Yanofskybacteria bacterium RIFCSPHIGHO2_02_FULL_43_22 TaxID=1802681 RepID=A0A1F8FMJ9_9BACT|nr:MAG: hypothetical protein A3J47_02240 [Candidatus Yanofskybacteria bacterium RIFCSPHIGHO2_02_FULL_43_22]